jgi:hypothetical protein
VLRSARFVVGVPLFCLLQKLCQMGNVHGSRIQSKAKARRARLLSRYGQKS